MFLDKSILNGRLDKIIEPFAIEIIKMVAGAKQINQAGLINLYMDYIAFRNLLEMHSKDGYI